MTVARIPKADRRLLFLFIDELFVLRAFRGKGVAKALLQAVLDLGSRLDTEGVRLIVAPENTAARRLYASCGFAEEEMLFCQRRLR